MSAGGGGKGAAQSHLREPVGRADRVDLLEDSGVEPEQLGRSRRTRRNSSPCRGSKQEGANDRRNYPGSHGHGGILPKTTAV